MEKQIGKYKILREVGKGGMGIVYKAYDTQQSRDVALKVLPSHLIDSGTAERFQREAKAVSRLNHSNIVKVLEVGETGGSHYFAMEYLEGKPLKAVIRKQGMLSVDKTVAITKQVAEALAYAHEQGIIHRDIKPANIIVDGAGRAKLVDFGLVQILGTTMVTRTGVAVGTPEYMSPEQVGGEGVDSRTDIYSLGVTMYEMLAGKPPFDGESSQAIALQHKFEAPTQLRDLCPEVPPEIETVITKAMAKDLGSRYQKVKDLLEDLDSWEHQIEPEEKSGPQKPREEAVKLEEFRPEEGLGRKSLAQRLLSQGLLTEEQLTAAVEKHRQGEQSFLAVLKELGMADEVQLMEFISKSLKIPSIGKLEPPLVDPEIIEVVPEKVARDIAVLPLFKFDGRLTLAMANPLDVGATNDIALRTACHIQPVVTTPSLLQRAIEKYYGGKEDEGEVLKGVLDELGEGGESLEIVEEDLFSQTMEAGTEAPIIKLVNLIIYQAIKQRASDIHIEPEEDKLRVRYRVDGYLRDAVSPPKHLQASITSRIKIMAEMDIAERRVPQDGRIKLRMKQKNIDIRVSTLPSIHGEKVVMRVLDEANLLVGLEELGFTGDMPERYERLITKPYGIILVTGPTGSGKTTTLYCTLHKINSPDKNIITVEDPTEYQLKGISQVEVNPKAGVTFASGLRSIFRQDPDIIMVGEMRDFETAQTAMRAALTGHLVFSTLHTNDAPGALTRLMDMGIPPYLIASSVIGILAQRLVRLLCPSCKEPYTPSRDLLLVRLGLKESEKEYKFYRPVGCKHCNGTGFRGRTAILELMTINEKLKKLVIAKSSTSVFREEAQKAGMKTLWEEGISKIIEGETSLEEVLHRTTKEED